MAKAKKRQSTNDAVKKFLNKSHHPPAILKRRSIDRSSKWSECLMKSGKQSRNQTSLSTRGTEGSGRPWHDLDVSPELLRPSKCLTKGQTFRFEKIGTSDWEGIVGTRIFQVRELDHTTLYRCVFDVQEQAASSSIDPSDWKVIEATQRLALEQFFGLHLHQNALESLSKYRDTVTNGVRVLSLDVVECLFCFICSSNNNIARITSIIKRLCRELGHLLVKGKNEGGSGLACITWYSFPSIEAIAGASEQKLRSIGLGYRAPMVKQAAMQLLELGGRSYLRSLRWNGQGPEEHPFTALQRAREQLVKLSGVGRKVADCICLYGLNHMASWPVDTHILQYALNDKAFLSFLKKRSGRGALRSIRNRKQLSPHLYEAIREFYQELNGPLAGMIIHLCEFRRNRHVKQTSDSD